MLEVERTDEPARPVFFTAAGREGGDPYYRRLYRVKLDGTDLRLLTPENADHDVTLAPDGRYFVDSCSTPDTPPVTVPRDAQGRLVLRLERADISRLVATGWKPPVMFTVKARDGVNDLHGLMFLPTDFDSMRRYPLIDNDYPGPQTWQGLLVRNADGTTNYDNQANQLQAKLLKGKLLIAYGTTDDNVPPYNSLLLVDALIAANKDFDLLALPNRRHGFGGEPYMVRRRWDYFVRNLLGAEPPREYRMHPSAAGGRGRRASGPDARG